MLLLIIMILNADLTMMDASRDPNGGTGMIANPHAQKPTEVGEEVVVVALVVVPAEVVDTTMIAVEAGTTIVEETVDTIMIAEEATTTVVAAEEDTIMIVVEDTIAEAAVVDTTMIVGPVAAVDGENEMIEVLRLGLLLVLDLSLT